MAQDKQGKDVSRRDLLKAAGAVTAVAAATVQRAPAIQKVRAANDVVQFGMIGSGSRGSYLMKHMKSIDSGRCVALCDIHPEASITASYHRHQSQDVQGLSRTARA